MTYMRRLTLVVTLVGVLLLGGVSPAAFPQLMTAPQNVTVAAAAENPCSPPPPPGLNAGTAKNLGDFVGGALVSEALHLAIPADIVKMIVECANFLGVFQPVQRHLEGDQCTYGGKRAGIIRNGRCVVPVDSTTISQDGQLLDLTAHFPDTEWATGFGFRGVKGSGWAEENHAFSSPSYGHVAPGQVSYPFNHACGTPQQIQSDVEFWINSPTGPGPSKVVHVKCGSAI